ncbi:MAG TPA: hypothetical protein PKA06_09525, partial [Gemmatales bacterium]|nr:hypothetical protein [Gemmatales bacterium]
MSRVSPWLIFGSLAIVAFGVYWYFRAGPGDRNNAAIIMPTDPIPTETRLVEFAASGGGPRGRNGKG